MWTVTVNPHSLLHIVMKWVLAYLVLQSISHPIESWQNLYYRVSHPEGVYVVFEQQISIFLELKWWGRALPVALTNIGSQLVTWAES